jgi:hypothetical protein
MKMWDFECQKGHRTEELYRESEPVPDGVVCNHPVGEGKCGLLAMKVTINKLVPVRMPMSHTTFNQGH